MVSQAIAKGDVQAVNYFVAQKYTEALRDIAVGNAKQIIFLPMEASSLLGSLGGIGELAKAAMGQQRGGTPPSGS